jgi:pyridinium-3,5-bisthiocarboxylic acid mononucleotide nickel chelatase
MKVILFDPFAGAAGDMVIGSLLDLGADAGLVTAAMRSVVGEPEIIRVDRAGISAVQVKTHAPVHHRTLDEVLERLSESVAPEQAKKMAERVFHRIHRAEEKIHGKSVHFHEVGADDAIADVVGACTAIWSLKADGIAVLPIALGRGYAVGSHGTFPIPAPATLGILSESGLASMVGTEERELCTPTGAALLAEFSTISPRDLGPSVTNAVGYGAGSRNPTGKPNVLRAVLIETQTPLLEDRVDILETSVDDVTGETLAYALARLMAEGARDASAISALMKKGRSGHLIRVICRPEYTDHLSGVMAQELGTLGIRCIPSVHRFIAERTIEKVSVVIREKEYMFDVKCGWSGEKIYTLKVEYEQARAVAEELGLPLQQVSATVEAAARNILRDRGVVFQ